MISYRLLTVPTRTSVYPLLMQPRYQRSGRQSICGQFIRDPSLKPAKRVIGAVKRIEKEEDGRWRMFTSSLI